MWGSDARKHCPGIAGHLLTRKLQQQYISEREECAHIPVQSGEDYCTAMNWTDDHLAKSRPPHACKPATRKYHLPGNCPPEFPQKNNYCHGLDHIAALITHFQATFEKLQIFINEGRSICCISGPIAEEDVVSAAFGRRFIKTGRDNATLFQLTSHFQTCINPNEEESIFFRNC